MTPCMIEPLLSQIGGGPDRLTLSVKIWVER